MNLTSRVKVPKKPWKPLSPEAHAKKVVRIGRRIENKTRATIRGRLSPGEMTYPGKTRMDREIVALTVPDAMLIRIFNNPKNTDFIKTSRKVVNYYKGKHGTNTSKAVADIEAVIREIKIRDSHLVHPTRFGMTPHFEAELDLIAKKKGLKGMRAAEYGEGINHRSSSVLILQTLNNARHILKGESALV